MGSAVKFEHDSQIAVVVREWLGPEGLGFFRGLLQEHGKINVVLMHEPTEPGMPAIPHPVHFREGMQVRNFLRTLPETEHWGSHDFDNNWIPVVKAAVSEPWRVWMREMPEESWTVHAYSEHHAKHLAQCLWYELERWDLAYKELGAERVE